jgi:hypothetical protein
MTDDKFVTPGRGLCPAARNFLPVCAADTHLKNLKLDLMRIVDMRFIPLGHVNGTFARINGQSLHLKYSFRTGEDQLQILL